jgi:hypothetical protein
MWPYPYAERFVDIGQWGQLTSTLLVLAFAAYKYILDPGKRMCSYALTGWISVNVQLRDPLI